MATQSWSPWTGWNVQFRSDTLGAYTVDTLEGHPTADVKGASVSDELAEASVTLSPALDAYGPFAREGLIAIKFYACPDGLEDELISFEKRTQSVYYPFMARVGWRYGGVCRVQSSTAAISQRFAEVYSVLARNRAEAEELDAQTKPEPQPILDMYAQCSRFSIKGSVSWLWLTPRA
jgi:hypothetical protein